MFTNLWILTKFPISIIYIFTLNSYLVAQVDLVGSMKSIHVCLCSRLVTIDPGYSLCGRWYVCQEQIVHDNFFVK